MDNQNKDFTNENVDTELENKIDSTEDVNMESAEQINSEEESFFGGGDNTYVKKADKYDDIRSSSITMLIVGFLGIIFIALSLSGVIRIPFTQTTYWLFYSIMSGVFIIFVIAGLVSFMHAKEVKNEAEIENKKIDEINAWADKNINVLKIDSGLDMSQPTEVLYFSRAEKIKNLLMHEFEDVDEGLIDLLTESAYQKLYENNIEE